MAKNDERHRELQRMTEYHLLKEDEVDELERLTAMAEREIKSSEHIDLFAHIEAQKEIIAAQTTELQQQAATIKRLRAFDRDLPDCAEFCPKIKEQAERIKEFEDEALEAAEKAVCCAEQYSDRVDEIIAAKTRVAELEAGLRDLRFLANKCDGVAIQHRCTELLAEAAPAAEKVEEVE